MPDREKPADGSFEAFYALCDEFDDHYDSFESLLKKAECNYEDAKRDAAVHARARELGRSVHLSLGILAENELIHLIKQKADPNARGNMMNTLMHEMCADGSHEALRVLHELNGDLTAKNLQGHTPIISSCAYNHFECVRYLLCVSDGDVSAAVRGAAQAARDHYLTDGQDALAAVEQYESKIRPSTEKVFAQLYSVAPDKDILPLPRHCAPYGLLNGYGLLHEAIRMGRIKVVEALLQLQSSVNGPEADRTTPLMAAACHCWPLISSLIKRNADPTIEVNHKTAWDLAVERSRSPYDLPPRELHSSGTDWAGFLDDDEVEVFFPDGSVGQSQMSPRSKILASNAIPDGNVRQTHVSRSSKFLSTKGSSCGTVFDSRSSKGSSTKAGLTTLSDVPTLVTLSVDHSPKAVAQKIKMARES